jgi:hypothetical protein
MKPASSHRLKSFCLYAAFPATLMTGGLFADDLEDLLKPAGSDLSLVDNSAIEVWTGVVDAFRRNDLVKAKELGAAFLEADLRTSPYQLLGVQVMMDLANADNPTVTRDIGLSVEMKRLMSEREALRVKYANLQRSVQDADARIKKLTNNRTQAVQAGTAAHRECVRAAQQMEVASAEMEAMKPEIEANKLKVGKVEVGANDNLKSDTLKLLDMLTEAGEIEAAFAIANVYIRIAGSDLDVAKKQQDVIRLREVQTKAGSIVKVIEGKQKALVETKCYWEALAVGEESLSKVSQVGDKDLTRLVTAKLSIDSLGIRRSISKAESESKALRELARVDALKSKSKLRDFRGKYPDFPELETLSIAVEGERSGEMKGKVADLLKSVEDLADIDPEQAGEILAGIGPDDIDPIDRSALNVRIKRAAGKLFLAAEATRTKETKEKIAELLNSIEDFADADPQRARELLNGLKLEDIDPVKRTALEVRISNAEGKMIASSIGEMESILTSVKSKLGGEVLQVLADGKIKSDSALSLSRQTTIAADIRMKIDKSAEIPEVKASLNRLVATIRSVSAMNPSVPQMSQINGIKAEVEVLRLAVK